MTLASHSAARILDWLDVRRLPAIADLVKRYDLVNAVNGISFTVPRGSVTALLGSNGAGETTMIAMMLGLLVPTTP